MSAAAVIPPHRTDSQWQYLRTENQQLAARVVKLTRQVADHQGVLDAAVTLVERLADPASGRLLRGDDDVFDPLNNAVADLPDLDERSHRLGLT